jgi:hypothetical protein
MKAKVTKPDGTVIELEGEPLELVMFLPDLKGFELKKFAPISHPDPVRHRARVYLRALVRNHSAPAVSQARGRSGHVDRDRPHRPGPRV